MENFQFRLLTYRLEAQKFLMEVAPDVLTIVPWCGILRNMIVSHTVPCHTCSTPWTLFLSHPLPYTHMTPQLLLRPGRPMFAAADFRPSDMGFNIRWST